MRPINSISKFFFNPLMVIGLLILCHAPCFSQKKILIVTGGHDFEEKPFFEMFDSFRNIVYDTVSQPSGNELIASSRIKSYDALIFYDMYQDITETQKSAYLDLLKDGMGMVFLHHSLVSYQKWPEFQKIIGGKYLLEPSGKNPKSSYKHDVEIEVEIIDSDHSLTKNIQNFNMYDEVYGNYLTNKNVSPILSTNHPESSKIIGWHHKYEKSKIVYLQSGHDHKAYENPNYRTLVHNAIRWVATQVQID